MVDKAFLEEVRDRLPISSVIGQYVDLKRAGSNFKGNCPFHHETKPSFMVSDDKQIYHCFGCGAGGDIFSFVMKHQGLSFPEAIEMLAREAGLEVPKYEGTKIDGHKDQLMLLLAEVTKYFHKNIGTPSGAHALKYVRERDLKDDIIKEHFLGYADGNGSGRSLVSFLKSNNHSLSDAMELGLIRQRDDGGYYDFFRNRLIFPIFSPRGKPIAFSGRVLDDQEPKYLNSPESSVFYKSTTLYGLNKAASSIRKQDQVLIVEGQLDVLSCMQANIENVVAPLGTAFTVGHIHTLSRYTKNFVVVFDGDSAGKKAAWRLLPIFLEENLMPKAVMLPNNEDPDTFIKTHGHEEFTKLVENAPMLLEFVLNLMLESNIDKSKRLSAIRQIMPMVEKTSNVLEKELYKKIIGIKLGIPVSEMEQIQIERFNGSREKLALHLASPEITLAKTLIRHPELYEKYSNDINILDIGDSWAESLISQISSKDPSKQKSKHLLHGIDDESLKQEITAISMEDVVDGNPDEVIIGCINVLKRRGLEAEMTAIDNRLRQGKTSSMNSDEELELLALKQKLEIKRRKLIDEIKEGRVDG